MAECRPDMEKRAEWPARGKAAVSPFPGDILPSRTVHILDSVYTERYMGQPGVEGNYKGYEESDVTRRAPNFHPTGDTLRKLYLVHGSRDDNVHLQHSMVLSKALVKEGVTFKQQVRFFGPEV